MMRFRLGAVLAVAISFACQSQDSAQAVRHDAPLQVVAKPAGARPAGLTIVEAEASFTLTDELGVDVHLWISEPLTSPDGSRPVRVVSLVADYNDNRLSINQAHHFGSQPCDSADAISADTDSVSLGIAKMLARNILGQEAGEFEPQRVGPFHVVVRPGEGQTWGGVRSPADLRIECPEAR